jgi:anaerobic selenocysteine-containing dehydrogenase
MVKGKKRCVALIHPQDAESRDLQDGDTAQVSSRVGSISIAIALSKDIMPGVISIPHGWGHQMDGVELSIAKQHAGVNTNILTDDYFLDTISGNAALNGVWVSVSKD